MAGCLAAPFVKEILGGAGAKELIEGTSADSSGFKVKARARA